MAHLDALGKRRSNLKGSMTKICKYAKAQSEIETFQLDIELLKVRLRRAETLLTEFHEVEQSIAELNIDDENQQDDFEEKYYIAVADLNKLIRKANLAGGNMSLDLNDTQGEPARNTNIEVKLPKINIAPFYGSYTEWQSFYDLFSSTIHENPNLNPAQKFQYLKGFLRNEAANLLKHLPISDANYIEALNKLKTRYDRKRYTVQSFIKNFVDMPSINNPTSEQIRKIMDTADEVIRGLKAIGPEAETRDPWLVYLLIQKLDEETRDKWASETASIEFPTCQSLIDFLMKRADALDSVKGYPRKSGSAQSKANTRTFAAAVASCSVCKSDYHPLYKCPKFKEWSVEERRQLMKTENRCFNCFSQSHGAYNCISKGRCHYCKKNHNSLLHLASNANCSPNEDQTNSTQSTSSKVLGRINPAPALNSQQCLHSNHQSHSAILPTATVKVQERNGQYKLCRVLLDSGSQTSMITEAFVQQLGLERKNGRVCIQGLANQKLVTTRGIVTVTISPHMQSSFTCEVSAYVVPSITRVNPIQSVEWLKCKCLTSLSLADLGLNSSKIDLLIGADKFFDILKPEQLRDSNSQIYAHNTHFGWILTGNTPHVEGSSYCHTTLIDDNSLDKSLKRFWESEEVFSPPALLPEHQICEDLFQSTTKKLPDSHYMVRLPFKPERSPLKASLGIAIKRLHSMEKKFQNKTKLQERYIEFMEEYKVLRHMVEVEPPEYPLDYLYLPHHGVFKETSTTTKLRVVFDASAKTSSGHSLNDNLLTGPTLQNLLSDILISFRIYKVAITADAEKMFRQIWIHPSDLRYQRIVWRRTPDLDIKHYELRTLRYGMSSAPYLATRIIKHIAEVNSTNYPEASQTLLSDMYVDDLLTGTHSLPEAISLAKRLSNIMAESGFNLRKWASNSSEFLTQFKGTEPSSSLPKTLSEDPDQIKVLGLQWQPAADQFTYHVTLEQAIPTTRREILSEASRIFDPLGLISPFVIKIKSFFQALWLLESGWDDKLPTKVQEQWLKIRNEIKDISTIAIPRWLFMNKEECHQLHGFCDSSEVAFAAAVYLRTRHNGRYVTNLIASKTKVAPIKNVSLPRLELSGALLLTRLISHLQQLLNIQDHQLFGWTDSTIVLDWLSEPPRKWKTYVANRTSEILNVLQRRKWQHISSKLNPADCATRGLSPMELKTHPLWWNGPEFLNLETDCWPKFSKAEPRCELERRENLQVMLSVCAGTSTPLIEDLIRTYSSYDKIVSILANIRKFISLCQKSKVESKNITRSDWLASEKEILRSEQGKYFREEIQTIETSITVSPKSVLKSLNPFLDKTGLLRVGGRIGKAIAPYETLHPIILSTKSEITKKIIFKYHKTYLHCGASLLMSLLRRKYWIVRARDIIKSTIRTCVYCIKQRPKTESQIMGSLPRERVQLIRPFLKIGLDFAGPIKTYLRRGRGQRFQKSYICLIVCLSTKAVHLEVVGDLTTQSFLGALNRFFARRGVSTDIFSDNGSNFRGASAKLKELNLFIKNNLKLISHSMLKAYQVTWHFIPPHAPHFGGIWEAGVKSAKTHMERVIGNQILTQEELYTLLVQIEGLLNSRPLCVLADDECDPLTPAHFLIGHPITTIPQPDITEVPFNRLDHWSALQKITQLFWKRWHQEYLTSIQARTKWSQPKDDLQVNDVVLVKEENPLVNQWKIGKVIQVFPGSDARVRVAEIKTNQGNIRRPITKLCRLPVN